jgi:hypothetical protein
MPVLSQEDAENEEGLPHYFRHLGQSNLDKNHSLGPSMTVVRDEDQLALGQLSTGIGKLV